VTVIDAGEAVTIQTPTAGGYGDPKERGKNAADSGFTTT